jgi:hypothetical protein
MQRMIVLFIFPPVLSLGNLIKKENRTSGGLSLR